MTWFVKAFLKSSLAWLSLGVTFGVGIAAHPAWTVYRLAHVHMLLLGFVAMMIFGVAYHVIPRFAGFQLHRADLARLHWWVANAGLLLMVALAWLRTDDWVARLSLPWQVGFYGANLLLPLGMSVVAGLWGAAVTTAIALGLCWLIVRPLTIRDGAASDAR